MKTVSVTIKGKFLHFCLVTFLLCSFSLTWTSYAPPYLLDEVTVFKQFLHPLLHEFALRKIFDWFITVELK